MLSVKLQVDYLLDLIFEDSKSKLINELKPLIYTIPICDMKTL